MKTKTFTSIILCCILFSCSRSLYMPASPDAALQQQLLAGRQLYVNHCGGCHNLHFPQEYNADGWQMQLNEMQPKAKITDEEKQLILQYLILHP